MSKSNRRSQVKREAQNKSKSGMDAATSQPSIDDAAGVAWWNGLTEKERAEAIERATDVLGRPASPADAWHARSGGRFDPRDENGDVMIGADRARGVDVHVGQAVLGSEDRGHVVAMTDECCVYEDAKGDRHFEAWACIHVQARGPAADAVKHDHADPFYLLAIEVARLSDKISNTNEAWGFELSDDSSDRIFGSANRIIDELYETSRELINEWSPGTQPPAKRCDADHLLEELQTAERIVDRVKRDITRALRPARRSVQAQGGQQQ